jgi:hypothetical protein
MFGDWLGQHMEQRGIRSGRRLAVETGLDEQGILDWLLGRRVPELVEVEQVARFFGAPMLEALDARRRSEQALLERTKR